MNTLRKAAAVDYNQLIQDLKDNSGDVDTIVSVVKCGVGVQALVVRDIINSSVGALKPVDDYIADGYGTPLFDSVGDLIEQLETAPDAKGDGVSFLVMVITDGQENRSRRWNADRLRLKIHELQNTDRWTFIFRVPKGYSRYITQFGIPDGNIIEWDQTERGVKKATEATTSGFKHYYDNVRTGRMSTQTFYVSTANVQPEMLKKAMVDISDQVTIWEVAAKAAALPIREFVESKKKPYMRGTAFYQLVKTESNVQDYKQLVIRDRIAGKVYAGPSARKLLGLPQIGNVRVAPGDHDGYDIFVQSTSTNRKLPAQSKVLYWPGAIAALAS